MITILYRELFNIGFLNSFYSSGNCPDLTLTPTADCSRLLQSCGLRFINTDFGGKVFGKAEKTGPANNPTFILKYPVPENTRFAFLIRSKNKTFETFSLTNLDRQKDKYYYFNNLVNNISTDNFPLLLSNTATKKVGDTDLLSLKSNSFSFAHINAAPVQTGELKLTDCGEVLKQTLDNYNNNFNFSFDLAKISQGRITFSIEGNPQTSFYNLYPEEGRDFFGIVEIFHRSALPGTYRFLENDNAVAAKSYKIAFASRSTRWRYLITKKFNPDIISVSVQKTSNPAIGFNPQTVLPTGQLSVASSNAVDLKEETVKGIELKDQANKTIIRHLPNPSLTHLKKEGADLFSDIFITI